MCIHLAIWAQVHFSYLAAPVSQDPKPSRGGYAIALVISIHKKKKDTLNQHLHIHLIQDAGTAKSVLTAFACTVVRCSCCPWEKIGARSRHGIISQYAFIIPLH